MGSPRGGSPPTGSKRRRSASSADSIHSHLSRASTASSESQTPSTTNSPSTRPVVEEAAPPLPDEEAPPLPDEEVPPLPDEEIPPLPDEEAPPLPEEQPPQLPDEAPPLRTSSVADKADSTADATRYQEQEDDGWQALWDDTSQSWYFYNRHTGLSQWENPRVPDATAQQHSSYAPPNPKDDGPSILPAALGGYNPKIHGDYDPNADYAKPWGEASATAAASGSHDTLEDAAGDGNATAPGTYETAASFNTRTGAFSNLSAHPTHTPSAHTDDAKSQRQMGAYFNVDAAANSHDGRSLKDERRNKKLTKEEVKAFRERRKEKREVKRRKWLTE